MRSTTPRPGERVAHNLDIDSIDLRNPARWIPPPRSAPLHQPFLGGRLPAPPARDVPLVVIGAPIPPDDAPDFEPGRWAFLSRHGAVRRAVVSRLGRRRPRWTPRRRRRLARTLASTVVLAGAALVVFAAGNAGIG